MLSAIMLTFVLSFLPAGSVHNISMKWSSVI
jgi:hypothetical protein